MRLCYLKAALAMTFIRKILFLKVEKLLQFVKHNNFKNITFPNAGKTGYQYTFACTQINMFSGWMSQDSIFMVNVEQNLFSDEKDSQKHVYIV